MPLRIIYKTREIKSFKKLVSFSEEILGDRLNIFQKIILWFAYTVNRCKKWG
jgi:hypothetical protein